MVDGCSQLGSEPLNSHTHSNLFFRRFGRRLEAHWRIWERGSCLHNGLYIGLFIKVGLLSGSRLAGEPPRRQRTLALHGPFSRLPLSKISPDFFLPSRLLLLFRNFLSTSSVENFFRLLFRLSPPALLRSAVPGGEAGAKVSNPPV